MAITQDTFRSYRVIEHQASLNAPNEVKEKHLSPLAPDPDVGRIVDRVNMARPRVNSQLDLHLPPDYFKKHSSPPTQLTIVDTENAELTLHELAVDDENCHLLSVASPSIAGVNIQHIISKDVCTARLQKLGRQISSMMDQTKALNASNVADVEIISPADVSQFWQEESHIPDTVSNTVLNLFRESAQRTPDAQAVVSWNGGWRYDKLDSLSNVLANEILARDTVDNSFVALCINKSLWTSVAMLAILKAGKAFMLLDPSMPNDGLRQVVSLLNPALVVTIRKHEDKCRNLGLDTSVLGPDWLGKSPYPSSPPDIAVQPNDPMCAIITPSNTGIPNTTILSHGSFVTNSLQFSKVLSLDSSSRVLQLSSSGIDFILVEVLTTLMVGGCVCVPSEVNCNDNIQAEIDRLDVNWAIFTPSLASFLIPEQVPTLKTMVLMQQGELASRELIMTWNQRLSLCIADRVFKSSPLAMSIANR